MLIFESKPDDKALKRHLLDCDALFPTPLSKRVNLDEYIEKLLTNANFIILSDNNHRIIGCLAYYDNGVAYISNLSVLKEYHKQGIAQSLIQSLIRRVGPRAVKLEVEVSNKRAISFYKKQGFIEVAKKASTIYLEKK